MPEFTGPELCAREAHEVVAMLKTGEVSPRDLLDASFSRIAAIEPDVNAMPTLCPERAYAHADRGAGGPLHGIPLGIKDLDKVAGVRCTYGTPAMANFVPDTSDLFVERLEANGGIVVGKTNTPELGAGANTFNPVFGATKNPWNTKLNPAGSSGGAAAALATGETWLSQGSDHGGSLRTPAAYCGIVGLRPTPGRVATTDGGPSGGWINEGVVGPMARSVRDCALFLDAMVGWERTDPASFPSDPIFEQAVLEADEKVRIAFAPTLSGLCPVEPVIAEALAAAMAKVQSAGAVVEEACPDLPRLVQTYYVIRAFAQATGTLRTPPKVKDQFKQTLKDNIEIGRNLTIEELANANLDRNALFLTMERFLRDFDVLACPVVGAMPRAHEIEWIDEIEGQRFDFYMDWLRFAFLATTCGLPAISVPIGLSPDGLPIGVQLIGPPRGEATVLRVARAVEMAVGGPMKPIDPVIS